MPARRTAKKEEPKKFVARIIRFKIFGYEVPIYLHTVVAVGILAGLWAFIHIADIPFFGQDEDDGHMSHLWNMIVFSSVALAITITTLYIVTKTAVQAIVLPHLDELTDMAAKWRRGEEITLAEAILSVSWAISSGLRVAGIFLMQALLATPL